MGVPFSNQSRLTDLKCPTFWATSSRILFKSRAIYHSQPSLLPEGGREDVEGGVLE